MRVYMRNKVTGEIKDVEADSSEFRELVAAVTAQGLPAWEQTSYAHADGVKERAKYGELNEEDLGTEAQDELRFKALELAAEGVAPEQNPHLQLTPGEIEAGLTPEQKQKDLEAQYSEGLVAARAGVFADSADNIAEEREEREAPPQSKGQLARAGGSDEREGVPMPVHPDAQEEAEGGDE